jgi:hypothetical protein
MIFKPGFGVNLLQLVLQHSCEPNPGLKIIQIRLQSNFQIISAALQNITFNFYILMKFKMNFYSALTIKTRDCSISLIEQSQFLIVSAE